jgi:hypothetical protein
MSGLKCVKMNTKVYDYYFINRAKELDLDFCDRDIYQIYNLINNNAMRLYKKTNRYCTTYGLKSIYEHSNLGDDDNRYVCDASLVLFFDINGVELVDSKMKCMSGFKKYKCKMTSVKNYKLLK